MIAAPETLQGTIHHTLCCKGQAEMSTAGNTLCSKGFSRSIAPPSFYSPMGGHLEFWIKRQCPHCFLLLLTPGSETEEVAGQTAGSRNSSQLPTGSFLSALRCFRPGLHKSLASSLLGRGLSVLYTLTVFTNCCLLSRRGMCLHCPQETAQHMCLIKALKLTD